MLAECSRVLALAECAGVFIVCLRVLRALFAQASDRLLTLARTDVPFSGLYRFGVNFRSDDRRFHQKRRANAGV
jgi:hypothetical protein